MARQGRQLSGQHARAQAHRFGAGRREAKDEQEDKEEEGEAGDLPEGSGIGTWASVRKVVVKSAPVSCITWPTHVLPITEHN